MRVHSKLFKSVRFSSSRLALHALTVFTQAVTVFTFYFTGIFSGWTKTAKRVFLRGDGFQMFRVDACTVSAKMIDSEAPRNWPLMEFVRKTMSVSFSRIYAKLAVTVMMQDGSSIPAFPSFLYSLPKTLFNVVHAAACNFLYRGCQ